MAIIKATEIMADIVNLKRARKDKARREREAAANRRRFGRTKPQKAADKDAETRAERMFEGKRIDRDLPDREPPARS